MIKQLSHLSLSTKNLSKVKKFYVNILKFKILHKFINEKRFTYGLFLNCGKKTCIEFFLTNSKRSNHGQLRHFCFEVNNIKAIAKKLKRYDKKIKVLRGKTDKVLQFMTKDFENNIIEFHQYDKKSKIFKKYK